MPFKRKIRASILSAALVVGALAATTVVWVWTQWLGSSPTSDQVDAHIWWTLLGHGISGIISVAPRIILNFSIWYAVGIFLVWLTAVFGWGAVFQSFWRDLTRREERLLFQFGIGTLLLALLVAGMGLCGAFRPIALGIILLFGWILFLTQNLWRRSTAETSDRCAASAGKNYHCIPAILSILIICYLIVGFLYALTPPMQSDGMRYHLTAVQEWLRLGRICYLPLNAFTNFPFLVEMHFVYGVAYGAPEVAQLIHFAFFVATGLALRVIARSILSEHAPCWSSTGGAALLAWSPAWLYWSTPANAIVAAWPFIDQAVNFYWVIAGFAALLAADSGRWRDYVCAGLFVGACLSAKYTSLGFAGLLLTAWLLYVIFRRQKISALPSRLWSGVAIAMIVALCVSALWYAKNWFYTRNPIYPLAGSLFGYGEFGPENAALYASKMAEKGIEKNFTNLLLSPVEATFRWTRFEHHFVGAQALIAPLLALAAVTACSKRGIRTRCLFYIGLGAGVWVMWFASYQSNRMIGGALAFFMAVAPLGLAHLVRAKPVWRVAWLAPLLSCVHGACYVLQYETVFHRPSVLNYLAGKASREEYLSEALNYYRAFRWLEQRVTAADKVLLIGEHRAFYAKFTPVWSDWFDTPAVLAIIRTLPEKNFDSLTAALKSKGVSWVLVNEAELAPQHAHYWRPRFREDEWQLLQQFLESTRWERYRIAPGVTVLSLNGYAAPKGNSQ
ncbi:MAG: glycosyltransferase family 39 protein [Candidatus Sumerlaeaceae bacterium]|nr:glycosyltransferase family 39 protein [Candidatus Sumerlaeaceae bacterium]